jgi:MFS family permease
MRSWLLRGLVFAFLMVLLRLVQGAMINTWETQAILISIFLVAVYFLIVFLWGFIDGRGDARAQPDPDRRADLAMTWLVAGLIAGVLSGAVCWLISMFYQGIYVEGLVNEVTTFAAFTALLVFVAAMLGVVIGRWLVDRQYQKEESGRGRRGGDQSADTDVFAAVSDKDQTGERPASQTGERPASQTEERPAR